MLQPRCCIRHSSAAATEPYFSRCSTRHAQNMKPALGETPGILQITSITVPSDSFAQHHKAELNM
eukprot:6360345-Amphidinium_carterae.1